VNLGVRATMALSTGRDLTFGSVIQGETSVSVDPIAGGNNAAFFSFTTSPNTPVTVTFSSSSLSYGVNSIFFTGTLAGNSGSNQSEATIIPSGNTITTNSSGDFYFWAGGTAHLSPTQPIGAYAGSFTLTVAY
jgi:Domain of unknown function (DUF4402)